MSTHTDETEGAGFYEALAWFEVNKKKIGIVSLLILVGGFAAYVINHKAHEKEVTASAELAGVRTRMNAGTNEPPVSSSAYLAIIDKHPGTEAAQRALLLGASALFTEGKYSEAQSRFEKILNDHASSPWAGEAAYGLAKSLEAQGKRDEALTGYQRVITSYGNDAVADSARMDVARIYEAQGKPDLALKTYEEITKAGMTMANQDAFVRRERILKQHPHLAPPPPGPATNAVSTNAAAPVVVKPANP